jgi:hypothetical protein
MRKQNPEPAVLRRIAAGELFERSRSKSSAPANACR